jgi:Zn-dependent protease
MGLNNFRDKLNKYFSFTRKEVSGIVVASIIFGFIVSYRDWGYGDEWELFVGLKNWINGSLISLLAILVHEAGHKFVGVMRGYKVETSIWWTGLFIALIVCFISRGHVWFFVLSAITLHHLSIQRLGKYRYGIRPIDLGMIALSGSLANIFLATFLQTLVLWFPSLPLNAALVHKAFIINWAVAAFNILPIPPLDGIHLFFYSRLFYVSIAAFMIGYGLLVFAGIYSWIFALVIMGVVWLIFYDKFERGAMK